MLCFASQVSFLILVNYLIFRPFWGDSGAEFLLAFQQQMDAIREEDEKKVQHDAAS